MNEEVYEGARLSAEPLSYQSHPEFIASDHCPVSASFSIKVSSDPADFWYTCHFNRR